MRSMPHFQHGKKDPSTLCACESSPAAEAPPSVRGKISLISGAPPSLWSAPPLPAAAAGSGPRGSCSRETLIDSWKKRDTGGNLECDHQNSSASVTTSESARLLRKHKICVFWKSHRSRRGNISLRKMEKNTQETFCFF